MAASDTKREQIIEYVVTEIEGVSEIAKVVRRMPSYADLQSFASTQIPACAVIGRLPVPVEHVNSRVKGGVDLIVSELKIDVFCYFLDNKTPDSTISNLLNELWSALYADQTKGDLTLSTMLKPKEKPEVWDPYGAFSLQVITKYQHTTGGI